VDAFWHVDAELGVANVSDGSTATVLLVAEAAANATETHATPSQSPAGMSCVLAHVGDSNAIRVDMSAAAGECLLSTTTEHIASNPKEQFRIKHLWAIRSALWGKDAAIGRYPSCEQLNVDEASAETSLWLDEKSGPDRLQKMPSMYGSLPGLKDFMHPTLAAVSEAAVQMSAGGELSDAYMEELWRAFRRETAINARRVFGLRAGSVMQRRAYGRGALSIVVTLSDGTKGADTCVSRSIGDWDAARCVLPHPEITHFAVVSGAHERVLIASDGLWDHVTAAEAAATARAAATVEHAVQAVLKMALDRSRRKFGMLSDDVTIVCVDLNTTGEAVDNGCREDRFSGTIVKTDTACCSVQ
jgi:serine/threonine protein phosphatase PrpC